MKNLVLMAVAIVAVSFASCGNKAADAAKAQQDSIAIADSLAAINDVAEVVEIDTTTVANDSVAVTETETVAE